MQSFLSIRHVHGDLYKPLGIDSSTDQYQYSNLFLNAYINCRSVPVLESIPNAYINRHVHYMQNT